MSQLEDRKSCAMKNTRRKRQMEKASTKYNTRLSHPRKEQRQRREMLILKLRRLDLQNEKSMLEFEIAEYMKAFEPIKSQDSSCINYDNIGPIRNEYTDYGFSPFSYQDDTPIISQHSETEFATTTPDEIIDIQNICLYLHNF